ILDEFETVASGSEQVDAPRRFELDGERRFAKFPLFRGIEMSGFDGNTALHTLDREIFDPLADVDRQRLLGENAERHPLLAPVVLLEPGLLFRLAFAHSTSGKTPAPLFGFRTGTDDLRHVQRWSARSLRSSMP